MQEAGVKDFQFTQWLALLAPAGTPNINRLNTGLNKALESKEVRAKFQEGGFDPYITTPEEAGKFIAREAERFSRLIRTRGITAN
jgi:tripartite-type tricarboxylate transporter receptor subunit TctC